MNSRVEEHELNARTKIIGMSSSGRTTDSGSVSGSSTLSIPAIFRPTQYMARSSSGLGRRPLKAEITSSNLVRATKIERPGLVRDPGFVY